MSACGGVSRNEENNQKVITIDTTQKDTTNIVTDNTPPEISNMLLHNGEVAVCKTRYRQSPINVTTPGEKKSHKIKFNYVSSHEVVENLGHTVELLYDKGSSVEFNDKTYQLVQFHFHTPSEHKIDGDAYPMEVHLVHRGGDSTYLVVSLLFQEATENTFLKSFIPDIPGKEGNTTETKKEIDLSNLFPKDRRFYTYSGSLTTPPYTEGVRWVIFKQPITCSKEQVAIFKNIEGFNARNLQPMNLRMLEEF